MTLIAVVALAVAAVGVYYQRRAVRDAEAGSRERHPIEVVSFEAHPGFKAQVYPCDESANTAHVHVVPEGLRDAASVTTRFTNGTEIRSERVKEGEKERPPEVPGWALSLFPAEDAERYGTEWRYHLYILIQEGKPSEARRVRRQLAVRGIFLACEVRARRALKRRGAR